MLLGTTPLNTKVYHGFAVFSILPPNAILAEPILSHETCLKTRLVPAVRCTLELWRIIIFHDRTPGCPSKEYVKSDDFFKKDAFSAIPRCHSENALLGGFFERRLF